jgi:hypothetical protein
MNNKFTEDSLCQKQHQQIHGDEDSYLAMTCVQLGGEGQTAMVSGVGSTLHRPNCASRA